MSKTLLGILLILLGIGSCLGTPFFLMWGEDPDQVMEEIGGSLARDIRVFEAGEEPVVDVPEAGTYTLFVVMERAAEEDGTWTDGFAVGPVERRGYRFVGPDGTTRPIESSEDAFLLERKEFDLLALGGASLSAGRWTLERPEAAADLSLAVGRFEMPEMFQSMLIGGGVGLFLSLVGLVLILIGISDKRRAAYAED